MRLLRLFAATFVLSLTGALAYRANLLFQALMTATGIAAGLAALGIVYTQTPTLGGWSRGEAVVLLGTYQIVSGLLATFVEPNVAWFAGQVKSGKLDEILLKPVSSLFLASLGSCAPLGLGPVIMGGVVVWLGVYELGAILTPWGWGAWLLLVGVGIVVTWAARVLVACVALWAPSVELDVVFSALWQFGRYPVSIYRQPIRFVLSYVLPVAFIATVPARALTRGASPWQLLAGLATAVGAFVVVKTVWSMGLRRYTSATS